MRSTSLPPLFFSLWNSTSEDPMTCSIDEKNHLSAEEAQTNDPDLFMDLRAEVGKGRKTRS
jgi:hypothetical protein